MFRKWRLDVDCAFLRRLSFSFYVWVLSFAIFAIANPVPAHAEANAPITLSQSARADIKEIEAYFNAITSLKSRFVQITSTGAFAEGEIYLSRPGRLRMDYAAPNPILIIANDNWLFFEDRELDQQSHIPLSQTPAGILVSNDIRLLGKDLIITGFEKESGALSLRMTRTQDPMGGDLTLVFSTKPLQLQKWIVNDAQGIRTSLMLQNPTFGARIDPALFKIKSRTLPRRED